MSRIDVRGLTFYYDGSFDHIFEDVSFSIDTDWKLGFIGRNGKGKTTFFKLLLGKYPYRGSIDTDAVFDYFPYPVTERAFAVKRKRANPLPAVSDIKSGGAHEGLTGDPVFRGERFFADRRADESFGPGSQGNRKSVSRYEKRLYFSVP